MTAKMQKYPFPEEHMGQENEPAKTQNIAVINCHINLIKNNDDILTQHQIEKLEKYTL